MKEKEYKYDVAFSLLDSDLALAKEINDLLADRYKTFLYSERQKEIAGTDGEIKFKEVFSKEARIVVVFFRENWGKTPWTRMEEEAIRGRAYEEGYDFVKFIPLDENHKVPIYLPKVQLWINATRFGAKGAASVIEARLSELSVTGVKENAIQRAARLQREIKFKEAKQRYASSDVAINDANKSFIEMQELITEKVEGIKSSGSLSQLGTKQSNNELLLLGLAKGLKVEWKYSYRNSLTDSGLIISLWKGHPPHHTVRHFDPPKRVQQVKMRFELSAESVGMWVDDKDSEYNPEQLAEHLLHFYLDNGS